MHLSKLEKDSSSCCSSLVFYDLLILICPKIIKYGASSFYRYAKHCNINFIKYKFYYLIEISLKSASIVFYPIQSSSIVKLRTIIPFSKLEYIYVNLQPT